MPNNINSFKQTLSYYLEEYAKEVPLAFRQQYIDNMLIVINHINSTIENGLNPELLYGHIAYKNLNILLENRRIEYFFKLMPDEELHRHLSGVILRAFTNPNLHTEVRQIEPFINSQLQACKAQLFSLLSENYFTLNSVFESLAKFISNALINRGGIVLGYNIYDRFYQNIFAELSALESYVAIETEVEFCTHQLKKFLSPLYVACLNKQNLSLPTINPVLILHNVEFSFFGAVSKYFNDARIRMLEERFSSILIRHQAWLRNLRIHITTEEADIAIRTNWNVKQDLQAQIKIIVAQQVKAYFFTWLATEARGMQSLATELLQYKNELIVQRAANALTLKICKKLDFYFDLPNFLCIHEPRSAILRPALNWQA